MKELQEFFKDIKRIADAMEKIVADNNEANVFINDTLKEVKSKVTNAVDENVTPGQSQQVQPTVEPVVQASVTNTIPVSTVVQTYTQDQLAVAMSRAVETGKMSEIQNILMSFGVDNLMALNPNSYNDLALKLREIGVEV